MALDDFGTGPSSLKHLSRLPVDVLKLDTCFVTSLDGTAQGSAVAEAVIRLGHTMAFGDRPRLGVPTPA